jgi:hypothetical protein
VKPPFIVLFFLPALALIGGAWRLNSRAALAPSAQPSQLPAAPMHAPARERAPAAADTAREQRAQTDLLALEIERALVSRDSRQRETAFDYLLPGLLQAEPGRVVAMVARQEPGEARDTLRTEVARRWIRQDRDAAIAWLKSLDEPERRASATAAVESIAASAPAQAIDVADQFGIGRDNGYLEHLVQVWATENPDAAERWIATQPDDQKTAQLRARIELVRAPQKASRG